VLVAAVLLVVVVIGTGAVQVFSQVVNSTIEKSSVYVPLAERFTVDSDAGDVTVVPSGDGQVHVRTVVRHGLGQPHLVEESTPSGVRLDIDCDDLLASGCDVEYSVELPPSFELMVSGSAGDVTARGLTGPIRVDRSGGDIALFDVTGPVDVTSSSGEITALGLRSDTVRAETRTGDVRLELLEPPQAVQVDAQYGEVDVAVPAGVGYRVSAWTRSGDRSVTVPVDPGSDRTITVDGGTGDVRLHTR
jgi:hypothetical protein